jgi:hypothetical protein
MKDNRNTAFDAARLVKPTTGCRTCGLGGFDSSLNNNYKARGTRHRWIP